MKINKKKFIVRTIEAFTILATIILTPLAIIYANKIRGYEAIGGEYFISILGIFAVMIIETIYEESEARKNEH